MPSKKPRKHSKALPFTSLRIIGERAQRLLARAREMRRAKEPKPALPRTEASAPQVVLRFSPGGVMKSALVIFGITVGALLLYLLQDKIVLLLLSIFVAAVIDPGVKALKRLGIPRGIGVILHYFIALFLFIFLLFSLIPILADQIRQIAIFINESVNAFLDAPAVHLPLLTPEVNARLTAITISTLHTLSIERAADALGQWGQSLSIVAQGPLLFAARLAGSVVTFFFNLILVLVLSFFIQIEKEKILAWVRSFVPWHLRSYVDDKSELINWKLGQWARGQLLLCASVAGLVFLALVVLRMPYALTLAILAGFTEFIPVIGLFAAAVPAVLIALTQQGLVWALMLACVYYVIQWCETNLLVPLIMRRTVNLSPVATLFAMLVGISFPSVIHPVLGIMLAIPLTTIIALFLEDWQESRARRARS
jgi:predicted PurR-regulated permease PerM